MDTTPTFSTSVSAMPSAQAPVSLLPRTAVTGATALSSLRTAASPMSPACTM
jgi:hypothetical protein